MLRTMTIALPFLTICAATPSLAQAPSPSPFPFPGFQGTPEDQAACHDDAIKFCKPYLADQFQVLYCLQQNRQRISAACQAVLVKYGQ